MPTSASQADDIRAAIKAALIAMRRRPLPDGARTLLAALGYESARIPALPDDSPDTFVAAFPAPSADTKSEREFKAAAQSVSILFQITDAEIAAQAQPGLFDGGADFAAGNARSFIFAAVLLKPRANRLPYARSHYARFAREINKRIAVPAVAIFQTQGADEISIAFINRRQSKTDAARDVLGSVSVIRGVSLADPHRAHTDILAQLALRPRLDWMANRAKPQNFDGLLAAWLDALDTDALTDKFYKDLFAWFQRAVKDAKFPKDEAKTLDAEEHIIRLITRILFVWFIKEKGLVSADLFVENKVSDLLKDYDAANGDSYYRAVLQNLFFATLNTEIARREFSSETQTTHRDFSRWRYKSQIANPDALTALFKETPFINGGLFDCLDSEPATSDGGYRIDCFSDNKSHYSKLSIPNRLFFDEQDGLLRLFERYKFTVEENTPLEREVALDPELLGNVFENLLAEYKRETWDTGTARKQTGAYYTPRLVVDYMVDESLVAALSQKARYDGDRDALRNNLRRLLDYRTDDETAYALFEDDERESIVEAVANLKIIDPAVGSGAFPMGILHKLTLALRRVDPDNALWRRAQENIAIKRTQRAYADEDDAEMREKMLSEINAEFERHKDSDFGRKLYLIQNAIYGVDIQPVAAQIAKLRFFISLAIEQTPTTDVADNYGIRQLPNLETRFVAANSLIGLQPGGDFRLMDYDSVTREINALNELRALHISAANRATKLRIIGDEERAQARLEKELDRIYADWKAGQPAEIEERAARMPNPKDQEIVRKEETAKYEDRKARFEIGLADAKKIAAWKPLDQNAPAAEWFDPEYMFAVKDGFDVVIGNPPYVRSEAGDANRELRNQIIASGQYQTLYEKWDLFIPFIERSHQLAKQGGFTTLIVSDAYCHARYARKSQDYFLANSRIVRLDFFGKIKLFQAGVHNIVYLFQKADGKDNKPERRVHYPEFGAVNLLPTDEQRNLTHRVFFPEDIEAQAFSAPTLPLSEICYISYGLRPSSKPSAPSKFVTADVTSDTQDAVHSKPYVDGKHLDYWLPATNLWLEWGTKRSPAQFYAPTFPEFYEVDDKLLLQKNTGANPKACYDDRQIVFSASVIGAVPWHRLAGIRNGSIRKQARYENEKQIPGLPQREQLETISNQYDTKFLLGVINSSAARHFLLANRRHNVSIYPDDWKKLPIPAISLEEQAPVAALVDAILAEGSSSAGGASSAATQALEAQVDDLVLGLYGLSAGEGEAVWRGVGGARAAGAGEGAGKR